MSTKYYTLDDLYQFCKANNFSHFSAKEHGGPIIVQSYGEFSAYEQTSQGLVPVTLQACHTELNRNNSFISEDTMIKALPSFANKPILGYIHQLDDGSYDFYTHNIIYIEDESNDDGMRIEYEERPIGVIPESCNAHLEYDDDKGKQYVVVTGYLYEDYGNRAVDIIKNNGGTTKVSVEVAVNEMSYNAKEGYLNIDDMYFMGVTCLGKTPDGEVVLEGMEGSNLKLDNFSVKENSMIMHDYSDKIVDLLSAINKKLDSISNKQFNEKGVEITMSYFEELLEKYNKTVEDIDFDYENMSNEDLEARFAELFDETEGESVGESEGTSEQDPVIVEEPEAEDPVDTEEDYIDDGVSGKKKLENSEIKYEISHDDIRSALYNLIGMQSEDGYCRYWIAEVYDDKFIYEDYIEGKYYRQKYSKDGEDVSLDGDPVEVFNEWLSKDEKDALDALKADYAALKSFKDTYDAEQIKSEKCKIFEKAEYIDIKESEGFKQLMCDMDQYSVDEIKIKADLLFAEYAKTKLNFAIEEGVKSHSVGINFNVKPKKKRAYASLFDE